MLKKIINWVGNSLGPKNIKEMSYISKETEAVQASAPFIIG